MHFHYVKLTITIQKFSKKSTIYMVLEHYLSEQKRLQSFTNDYKDLLYLSQFCYVVSYLIK